MNNLNSVAKREIVNVKFGITNLDNYCTYIAIYAYPPKEKEPDKDYLILQAVNLFQLVSEIDKHLEPKKIHRSEMPISRKMVPTMVPKPKPLNKEDF